MKTPKQTHTQNNMDTPQPYYLWSGGDKHKSLYGILKLAELIYGEW